MKKFLLLFLALSLLGGAAFSEDLGLTAGVEFNIGQLNPEGNVDVMDTGGTNIRPFVIWEADLVENLDITVEMGLPFWGNTEGDDNFWMDLDLNIFAAYHLGLSPEGTLRFSLESDNLFEVVRDWSPRFHSGTLIPGVKYTHDLGGMSVFGKVGLPFLLFAVGDAARGVDPLDEVGIDFTLGMGMDMNPGTLGFELGLLNSIRSGGRSSDDFARYLTLLPSFTFAAIPLYAEVDIIIPIYSNGMDFEGVTIIPEFRYDITSSFQAWVNLPIFNVGADYGDVGVGLGIGVQFSF